MRVLVSKRLAIRAAAALIGFVAVCFGITKFVINYRNHDAVSHNKETGTFLRLNLDTTNSPNIPEEAIAVQAAEFVRITYNSQRRTNCKSIPLIKLKGEIHELRNFSVANISSKFAIEAAYGEDTIYAVLSVSPKEKNAEKNTVFKLLWSAPGPCEILIEEQLAVTTNGEVY